MYDKKRKNAEKSLGCSIIYNASLPLNTSSAFKLSQGFPGVQAYREMRKCTCSKGINHGFSGSAVHLL
jgi:hypothetical protein